MRGLVGERRARGARPRPQPFRAFRAPIQGRRRLAGLRRLHPTIPTHAPLPACVLVDDGRRPPRGELLALRAFEGPSRSLIHPITRRKGCRPTPPLSVVMRSRPPPPRAPPPPRVAPLPRPTAHSRLKTLLGGRSLELEVLLQAHAAVGIALAGFASVVAALRRPLSVLARQRFLSLLALAVIQILGCLLPMWFMHHLTSSELGWRVLSAVLLVLSVMRIWWLVLLPARHLGVEVRSEEHTSE